MRAIFQQIYDTNFWGNKESISGNGSTLEATAELRRVLPMLLDHYDIHRVYDAACGDAGWWHGSSIPHAVQYMGVDIVPDLVERNKAWYGEFGSRRQTTDLFMVADITRDPMPPADLILARDVLVHLSNADVKKALVNIKASNAKYLLATTFPNHHQSGDMTTGAWRPLNLAEYWGLGSPIELINEHCTIPGFEDKAMGLWELK
jgi:SAM-dependent methyltransferase